MNIRMLPHVTNKTQFSYLLKTCELFLFEFSKALLALQSNVLENFKEMGALLYPKLNILLGDILPNLNTVTRGVLF